MYAGFIKSMTIQDKKKLLFYVHGHFNQITVLKDGDEDINVRCNTKPFSKLLKLFTYERKVYRYTVLY